MEIVKISYGDRVIYGKLYMPEGQGIFPAIIMSHGYNGSANDWDRECEYYSRNGYIALSYDFTGGSTGSRSKGLLSNEMTIFTEKEDLIAVFEYLINTCRVDKEKVFLFGGSMGGLVTALTAEEKKDNVKAVILYYPALCIPDNWRDNYKTINEVPEIFDFWGLSLGRGFVESIRDFYTFDNIGTFEGKVFIIHGDEDEVIPLLYSDKAMGAYKDARLMILKGEGHGFSSEGADFAMKEVLKFMNEN